MPSRRDGEDAGTPDASEMTASSRPLSAMSPGPVISNTTPLITLGAIGLLDTLHQLYGTVRIPSEYLPPFTLNTNEDAWGMFNSQTYKLSPGSLSNPRQPDSLICRLHLTRVNAMPFYWRWQLGRREFSSMSVTPERSRPD